MDDEPELMVKTLVYAGAVFLAYLVSYIGQFFNRKGK